MVTYDHDPRAATGRLFSRMMVTVVLVTTLALIAFGAQSGNHEAFGGRTPSLTTLPAG